MGPDRVSVRKVDDDEGIDEAFRIRERVFVREQGVTKEDEFDGLDEESTHFGAYLGDRMVGCGRVRFTARGAKLERIAVVPEHRRKGIGISIVEAMVRFSLREGEILIYLHSQASASGFYERCGFAGEGNHFIEAGIPHVMMVRADSVGPLKEGRK